MKAQNITTGIDPARIQQDLPAFFISWNFNGEQHYKFSVIRSHIETIKKGLLSNPKAYTEFYIKKLSV